jgi:hypothetical protein
MNLLMQIELVLIGLGRIVPERFSLERCENEIALPFFDVTM